MKCYLPFAAVAAVIALLLLLALTRQRHGSPEHGPSERGRTPGGRRQSASAPQAEGGGARLAPRVDLDIGKRPLPASLQGTEVPGGLAADADGHLILAPGVRVLFDHFLSASGEEPLEVIKARIVAEIHKRLPPGAAREAIELLDRYLEYRDRARDLHVSKGEDSDLDARLEQIRSLRRQVFGDEAAEALFGEEEALDYVAVAEREIARDPALSPEEKRARIEEIEQQLPEPIRRAREETLKPLRYMQEEAALRERGAAPSEIRALREQYFGAEAADRLEALDRENAEWDRRMADYRSARAAIEQSVTSERARRAAIDKLKTERFSEPERMRVEALEEIERQNAAAPGTLP